MSTAGIEGMFRPLLVWGCGLSARYGNDGNFTRLLRRATALLPGEMNNVWFNVLEDNTDSSAAVTVTWV